MKYLCVFAALLSLGVAIDTYADTPDAGASTAPMYECKTHPCVVQGVLVGPIDNDIADEFMSMIQNAQKAGADAFIFGIASPGGDFHASFRIYRAISRSKMPFYCYVKQMAASGAFWILQACKERVAEPSAMLMTHTPRVIAPADTVLTMSDLRAILNRLTVLETIMVGTIAPRMGMTPAALSDKLAKGDWFMNPLAAINAKALDLVWSHSFADYVENVRNRKNSL